MPTVLYLVRSPLHTLSHALLSVDDSAVVLSLEDHFLPVQVLRATSPFGVKEGDHLSYKQLLAMVLKSEKVLTL